MFGSKTILAQMMRGGIAAALMVWALVDQSTQPVFAAAAGAAAVIAMRGCPLCWTLGLIEAIGETIRVQSHS
jgi:nicotinamide riboside transporter PnuC